MFTKSVLDTDPISRPGLLTNFHLVFAGPSLRQHKFWGFNITLSGPAFPIVFVYYPIYVKFVSLLSSISNSRHDKNNSIAVRDFAVTFQAYLNSSQSFSMKSSGTRKEIVRSQVFYTMTIWDKFSFIQIIIGKLIRIQQTFPLFRLCQIVIMKCNQIWKQLTQQILLK